MEEQILIKYIQGKLAPKSVEEVENWIQLSDENRKAVEDLYVLLFLNDRMDAKREIDVNETYKEFKQITQARLQVSDKKIIPLWRKVAGVAVVAAIILFSGLLSMFAYMDKQTQPMLVSTKVGERAEVLLPDGSRVWINACSSLEYKKLFLSRKRKIKLTGEAYFEVAHNAYFPFIVQNNKTEVRVLGTKFNIRSNDDDNYITTTLFNGSISFSDNEKLNITLKPGEELVFDKTTRTAQVRSLDYPEDALNWINGKLMFENSTLEDIAKNLERHYNVNIRFKDDNVKQKRFTAEFESADNIYQILSILELTQKFNYKIEGRRIFIWSKNTIN